MSHEIVIFIHDDLDIYVVDDTDKKIEQWLNNNHCSFSIEDYGFFDPGILIGSFPDDATKTMFLIAFSECTIVIQS